MENCIRVWGTRAGFPNTDVFCSEYGGDTACISYESTEAYYVFDAGSGLAKLGRLMADNDKPIFIFISSFRADKLMGLFSFEPFNQTGRQIYIYVRKPSNYSFEGSVLDLFNRFLGEPYSDVNPLNRGASVFVSEIFSGDVINITEDDGNEVAISVFSGSVVAQTTYYRFKDNHISFLYAMDDSLTEEELAAAGSYMVPGDVVFSAAFEIIPVCERRKTRNVYIMQYDLTIDDEDMFKFEKELKAASTICGFARQGMVIQ